MDAQDKSRRDRSGTARPDKRNPQNAGAGGPGTPDPDRVGPLQAALLDALRTLQDRTRPDPATPAAETPITETPVTETPIPETPVAADPRSQALLAEARRAARTAATILIEGPPGSGKERLARFVHACSPRRAGPFLAINCAALPEAMQEALLFGHERGAFTGAHAASAGLLRAADGGTLFLDEVGELPPALQAKLLRALQEREVLPLGATRPVPVDVRILAATNRSLAADVAAGRFREDLFWRLSVFPLKTLPLAHRRADILPLLAQFLNAHAQAQGQPAPLPEEPALERLLAHDWPGNVRELGNVVERALILSDGKRIRLHDLRFDLLVAQPPATGPEPPPADLSSAVRAREAEAIRAALERSGGRRTAAAATLGISERTLRYKLAAMAGRPRRSSARRGADATRAGGTLQ